MRCFRTSRTNRHDFVKVAAGSAFVAHGIATGAAVHPVAAAVGAGLDVDAGVSARRPRALPVDMYLMDDHIGLG